MKHRLQVASVPDRDEPVVEIWVGDDMWCEIRLEDDRPRVQIFSRENEPWDFDLEEVRELLERGRQEVMA
jgi:hypothetical protein